MKTTKKIGLLIILYLMVVIFVENDAWLYKMPIVKITKVSEEEKTILDAARNQKEVYYEQTLTGILQNGTRKGKGVILRNEYSYSGVLDQKYHKGDKVFVGVSGKSLSGGIKGIKRDGYLVVLLGGLLLLLLVVSGKNGLLTIGTFVVNLMIFGIGFARFLKGEDLFRVCNVLAVSFTLATLILLNGFRRKTWAAICSALCVLVLIMWLFDVVTLHMPELDFSTMEYLGSLDNPDDLFRAEIMLSGLGAIMDVTVTISTAMEEIVKKNSRASFLQLFHSGREIGYDIMGTMMNVLLFVFVCGLIPAFLIHMNNEVSFFTIIKWNLSVEICRFLVESIGIILAIPISILIASICMKITFSKEKIGK